jgi:hypothetical protein
MGRRLRFARHGLSLALALSLAAAGARAATITIVNLDLPGQGLNDPTPAAPIGGNPGTTLGEQRLNVLAAAASIWGDILPSNVPIRVEASFAPRRCAPSTGVLASAGPKHLFWDFPNAPFGGTSYGGAEADKFAAKDLRSEDADIAATFNSEIGSAGCLAGYSFYLGFDHQEGPDQFDLLPVALHEIAHGLGFLTFTEDSTGAFAGGVPDIFSRFILDANTGLHWNEETDAQRAASDTATFRLLWDGQATRERARSLLGPRPVLRVNSPLVIAGDHTVGVAMFGAPLTTTGVTGVVALADDGDPPTSDGCTALVDAAQVAGRIALVDRGGCPFATKVRVCQDAGAIGVIVADDAARSEVPGMSGVDTSITIPSVRITRPDGLAIRGLLGAGVSVTLMLDPTQYAGADPEGRVMLYAPRPRSAGSSINHWDVTAMPNLLMEPNLNPDESSDVDLTRYAFEDMGWFLPGGGREDRFGLSPSVPNPFQHTTAIGFWMLVDGEADLAVYDVAGRLVKRLSHGAYPAGSHQTAWDGIDERGQRVRSGVYFTRLRMLGVVHSGSVVLVR